MIVCLSASHKRAKLPMLESLAVPDEDAAMKSVCEEGYAQECMLLQTCHRVEFFCVVDDSTKDEGVRRILRFWSAQTRVSYDVLNDVVEVYQGREALSRLFFLAAGLESMVLGEDQILGQVRTAYVKAKKLGTVGSILDKVCMKAINTGRRVRTETKINEGSVSISSAAVDLAAKELGQLSSASALVIGAGEAGAIAAETLKRRGTKNILIANRTYSKSLELASKVSGKPIKFNRIIDTISKVDLVISAVSVGKPILRTVQIKKALVKGNYSKKLAMIDISQPRSIEERVGLIDGVTLRNIDDLEKVVEESIRNRQAEAGKAKEIVSEELGRLELQLSRFLVEPLVSKIYNKIEGIRRKELGRAVGKMRESDERKLAIMDRFSKELIERILHIPIEQLRSASLSNDAALLSSAEKLFQIKSEKGEKIAQVRETLRTG
jgi:glutamyl-tRNA reductase